MHNATEEQLIATFTEWERRYREEPDRFMSEAKKLLTQTPRNYGEACAPYFLQILSEVQKPNETVTAQHCVSQAANRPSPLGASVEATG